MIIKLRNHAVLIVMPCKGVACGRENIYVRVTVQCIFISCVTEGFDFYPVDDNVVFPLESENGDAMCFEVAICDDKAFEKVMNFTVKIASVEDNVDIIRDAVTVFIVDNDRECTPSS
jgi:hypothetical protein